MHPILDALDGTSHEWIKKLLFTFNEGNIGKFEALAPLFPQEVCMFQASPFSSVIGSHIYYLPTTAYSTRELLFPPTEDLSYGSDRVCLQTRCR